MHRAGYTRIVGSHEYLAEAGDLFVTPPHRGLSGGEFAQVKVDIGVILGGGNDAVCLGDASVLTDPIVVEEDSPGHLDRAYAISGRDLEGGTGMAQITVEQPVNELD